MSATGLSRRMFSKAELRCRKALAMRLPLTEPLIFLFVGLPCLDWFD